MLTQLREKTPVEKRLIDVPLVPGAHIAAAGRRKTPGRQVVVRLKTYDVPADTSHQFPGKRGLTWTDYPYKLILIAVRSRKACLDREFVGRSSALAKG
jgi:hypothetical protein